MADDPLLKKLRFPKEGTAAVIAAPDAFARVLKKARGVSIETKLAGKHDFIQVFVTKKADALKQAKVAKKAMSERAILWFCYPKAKGEDTDLNRDVLRESVEELGGLEAVSMVAIDDVWSGLRFKRV
jgi:hypothetical protein